MESVTRDDVQARLEEVLESLADVLEDGARFLDSNDMVWLVQEVSCLCQEALFDRYRVTTYRAFGAVEE